jgi:acetylornithine deacetylase/succinyl-diaminopimelate desuccinylase-like protein
LELTRKKRAAAPPLPEAVGALEAFCARDGVRESLQFFVKEYRWIDERHLACCRIPAPTFFEQKRAEWFAEELKSYGWAARLDRAGNVLATLPETKDTKDGPLVAVTAHLDTVLAPRAEGEVKVEGRGRLFGPGVADNGAGLAALLALGKAIGMWPGALANGARPVLVANVGEEGEGNLSGMRFLCKQPIASRIRAYLVVDGPGTDRITTEALASRRFELSVQGPGGHSWSDHGTANPVHALSRAVTWFVDARNGTEQAARCSYNFGVIEGGSTVNAIPTAARAKVDLRSEDLTVLDGMAAELSQVLEKALLAENESAAMGRVAGKLRETGSRPGGRLAESSPALRYVQAVDEFLGIKAWPDCASTDANVPLSMGLQALSIGAGGQGGGAHTPAEWYEPEGRHQGLKRVYLTLCLLLADAADGA